MALYVALLALLAVGCLGFLPHDTGSTDFLADALLREVVERMGKDLADAPGDNYVDFSAPDPRLSLIARATKDLENEQFDYDSLTDGNPIPSLRDQEYIRHSALWKQIAENTPADIQKIRPGNPAAPVKSDAALPAYCNPPNPCPVGYTEDQGCTTSFENTAAFSRDYQAEQDCMCDREHMFQCPASSSSSSSDGGSSSRGGSSSESDHAYSIIDRLLAQNIDVHEHKNLVAKKYHVKKSANPYLTGEKLPVAAKKGINVDPENTD